VETFKDEESVKFLNSDPEAKKLFSETKKIKDVNAADYVAIFVIGGVSHLQTWVKPLMTRSMDRSSIYRLTKTLPTLPNRYVFKYICGKAKPLA
jgi:hypothetical protein